MSELPRWNQTSCSRSRAFVGAVLRGRSIARSVFVRIACCALGVILVGQVETGVAQEELQPIPEIPAEIQDTLEYFCFDCHSGSGADADLYLDELLDAESFGAGRDAWEKVLRIVRSREMPPEDMEQPEEAERLGLITWIDARLKEVDCGDGTYPGRVTIRRLNRGEYNNTIRDLTGIDYRPADDFPSDDVGNGFDNIGDVLSMPPLLVEKYLEASSTVIDAAFADDAARRQILISEPADDEEQLAAATRIVRHFASRAYRRPVTEDELARLLEIGKAAFNSGADYEESLKFALKAVLVSPNFLFKVEAEPGAEEDGIHVLNDYELAVRLSYFLWSSMPDDELFELAKDGRLHEEPVLARQVVRMLNDPKSEALVTNFAGQWLQLRSLTDVQPDPELFPTFDAELRYSMRGETEAFFRALIDENRSILEFLTADFTYVDERLAEHYGLDWSAIDANVNTASQASESNHATDDVFVRVSLPENRRGVLTHGSILMITSNPTRTSPVKRGKWILDNILGEPPPPPPDGVEELEEQPELLGSLRERMEQHRENEACAVCHRTMDTLGFGLENFDVIGAWRDEDGRYPIDASGALPGGVNFSGTNQLMEILATQKREAFSRCLTEKMLTYALGRGLQNYDRCAVDAILEELEQDEHRFVTLIEQIVLSEPFRKRAATREKP